MYSLKQKSEATEIPRIRNMIMIVAVYSKQHKRAAAARTTDVKKMFHKRREQIVLHMQI